MLKIFNIEVRWCNLSILNLTRKVLPAITKSIAQNRASVQNLPEMRLAAMMRSGDKSIVNVGMNECKAVRMLPGRINTITQMDLPAAIQ